MDNEIKTWLFIVLFSLLIFSGCHEEEEYGIVLSNNEVDVLAGEEVSVRVYYLGKLSISNDNPDIATVWPANDGNNLVIMTTKVGTALIRLIDHDKSKYAQLIVHSHYLGGAFEEIEVSSRDARDVFAVAQDKNIENQIKEELRTKLKERLSTRYEFDSNTNRVKINFSRTPGGGELVEGTYRWEPTRKLTLNYNWITEFYAFTVISESDSERYGGEGKAVIMSKFTEKYKERYPEAGIESVSLTRVLSGSFDFEN
jgi:hypothetical protein